MAKAYSSLHTNFFRPYDHAFRADVSKEALTNALLETVRLVLEGHESAEEEKQAPGSPGLNEHHAASSEQTSSDSYLPAANRKKVPAPKSGVPGGPCAHCGATDSPQWRRPLTKKVVLCNACGIYYSRHHSLPKRKKMPVNSKQDMVGGEVDRKEEESGDIDQEGLACNAAPENHASETGQYEELSSQHLKQIKTARESTSSGDCMQYHEFGKQEHAQPLPYAMPADSVSMAYASPATSCGGSPMHYSSGVAAPPSTPKKRTDDYIDNLFEAHAEDSLAKRVMKRAATASMTANAAAASVPVVSTGDNTPRGSPRADWRPSVTTSLAGSAHVSRPPSGEFQHSSVLVEAMLGNAFMNAPGSPLHAASNMSGIVMGGELDHAPGALGEQSADSDAGLILLPASTSRGPRSRGSSPRPRSPAGRHKASVSRHGSPAGHSRSYQPAAPRQQQFNPEGFDFGL